jgi:hypothetical protein
LNLSNKGALGTLAILIVTLISLAIMLIILLQSGLIGNLQTIICTTLVTLSSWVRGFIIDMIWLFYWVVFGVLLAAMFLLGNTCRTNPISVAVCLAIFAGVMIVLAGSVTNLMNSIPLLYCPNPDITVGNYGEPCGSPSVTTSKIALYKEMSERAVDCWRMYTSGTFDPLSGKTPPNPINCYVINFNIREPMSFGEWQAWMSGNNYSITGKSYLNQFGGHVPIIEKFYTYYDMPIFAAVVKFMGLVTMPTIDKIKEALEKQFTKVEIVGTNVRLHYMDNDVLNTQYKKGRIFIKYGDDGFFTRGHWGSQDCTIDESWEPPLPLDVVKAYVDYIGNDLLKGNWGGCLGCLLVWDGIKTMGLITAERDAVYVCIDDKAMSYSNCQTKKIANAYCTATFPNCDGGTTKMEGCWYNTRVSEVSKVYPYSCGADCDQKCYACSDLDYANELGITCNNAATLTCSTSYDCIPSHGWVTLSTSSG